MVLFTGNHFRSSIARTTTCSFQSLVGLISVAQSKIYDFNVVLVVQQQVFRFKVSMANTTPVDILNPTYYLLEKSNCFQFF